MRNLKRILIVSFLSLIVVFTCTTSAIAAEENAVTGDGTGQTTVENPGLLEEYGPPGGLITITLGGLLMIARAVNEGKTINVQSYKTRAEEAENRSNEEIGKVHTKLEALEKKLDAVIKDRDEYRAMFEARKAEWNTKFLEAERRHRAELESVHDALVVEISVRHKLEELLAANNIPVPETPPPYTPKLVSEATPEDVKEADDIMQTTELPRVDPS